MSYLVLARKYRPQQFEEVVGQKHAVQTLTNAITSDRVAHAILFSGPRGTGKTTIARILAKAMNCEERPTPTPCNRCRSCRDITAGSAADVFEIDGASNNGVDQVRELRNNVRYLPQHSRHKIYIIDEVHMLSVAAFNALLKTLEEPPAHVLFFFATTESHKIPITILSRCQRHDLKRIDIPAISGHMASLCQKEQVEITPESLDVIARESDGCMRDALSLLDQIISFSSGSVDHNQIMEMLGAVDRNVLDKTTRAIISHDVGTLLDVINGVFDAGQDVQKFFGALVSHVRDLLVLKMGPTGQQLLDLPAHEINELAKLAAPLSQVYLAQMTDLLLKEQAAIKYSPQPKLSVELACIKAAQMAQAVSIDTLIEKIDALRNEFYLSPPLESGTPGAPLGNDAHSPPMGLSAAVTDGGDPGAMTGAATPQPGKKQAVSQEEIPSPSPAPEPPARDRDADPEKVWEALYNAITDGHPSMAAPLKDTTVTTLGDKEIALEIKGTAFEENLVNRKKKLIEQAINDYFGVKMVCRIQFEHKQEETKKKPVQTAKLRDEALHHPLVANAVDIFRGKVVDIKIL
jgi:DNA polymerase-3 subunit gamma/tau